MVLVDIYRSSHLGIFIFVESFSYSENKGSNKTATTASKLKEKPKLNSKAVVEPQSPNNSKFNIRLHDTQKLVTNELLKGKSKPEKAKISPRIKQIIGNIVKETRNNLLKIKSLNEFRNEAKKRLTNLYKN